MDRNILKIGKKYMEEAIIYIPLNPALVNGVLLTASA